MKAVFFLLPRDFKEPHSPQLEVQFTHTAKVLPSLHRICVTFRLHRLIKSALLALTLITVNKS